MRVDIYFYSRYGKYEAKGIYEDGIITVLPGSRICQETKQFHMAKKASEYRNNLEFVDQNGIVLKECVFSSASSAAQFVSGCSRDGLLCWRIKPEGNLKSWLAEHPEEVRIKHSVSRGKKKPKKRKQQNSEQLIIALLVDNPTLSMKDLAKKSGMSAHGVFYHLSKLKKKNIIKREGARRNGHWVINSH